MTGLAPTIGRQPELSRLRAEFVASAPPAVRVLVGMGGVGKTSIARAYSDRHRADYGIVWWVRAEDPAAIDAEFRALLDILLPPGQAAQVTNARTTAFDLLARQDQPWLLVLDNVPDAAAAAPLLPPAGPGHILITSRATAWPDPKIMLRVHPLDTRTSVELLTSVSGDDDRAAAEALAEELGGLPLALTQAAGFARTNRVDLVTYLRLYRERSAELHQDGRPADYPHTVTTTWQLAIDRLSEKARDMLNILAFYAPDAIPVHLLFQSWDELARHRAIGELHAHSLITPAGSDKVTIHRLIQAVTRNRLRADLTSHEWADRARELIWAAMPEGRGDRISLTTWNDLRTHVQVLLDHLPPEHPDTLSLRHGLTFWTWRAGNAVQARDQCAELAPIRQRVLGAEHPDTLSTRAWTANLTGWAGNAVLARDLLGDLHPICERTLGVEHPVTMDTQNALAWWTGEAGDAVRARDLYADLLAIRKRVLGPEDFNTLIERDNVAVWTGRAGNSALARDLLAQLIPDAERVWGAEHEATLTTRLSLAYFTGKAGDSARARDLSATLLPIRERVMGREHPRTLRTRYDVAFWTAHAGDVRTARSLFTELLPIQEKILGTEHPQTVRTREELARLRAREEVGPGGDGEGEDRAGGVLGVADGHP